MPQRLFFGDTDPLRKRVYTALDGTTVEGSYGDYSTFPTGFTEVPWPVPSSPNPNYYLALVGAGYSVASAASMSNYTPPTSVSNFDPTPTAGPVGDDIEPSADLGGPLTNVLEAAWVVDSSFNVVPTFAFFDAPNTVRLTFFTPPPTGSYFMLVALATHLHYHNFQIDSGA